jgi:Ig-like domain CHU_C associated/Secretion system C-terminal sorting domain/Beta-propeller repeat
MKTLLSKSITLLLLLTSNFCSAQLSINWANKINCETGGDDHTAAITGDSNGNIISVGSFEGNVDVDPSPSNYYLATQGSGDIYMLKYDTAGALIWAKTIGGATNDQVYDVLCDPSGNIYITGFCSALTDFDGGGDTNFVKPIGAANSTVLFLAKYDANGTNIWAKVMPGTVNARGKKMKLDSNGDIILVGNFAGTLDMDPSAAVNNLVAASTNFSDIFISKYNNSGALIWAKKIGGSVYDEVNGMTLDSNDNIYITGYMNQTVDFDPGSGVFNLTMPINNQSGYVAKYTSQGAFVWATLSDEEGYDLAIDAFGKLRVAASSSIFNPTVRLTQFTLAGVNESYLEFTNSGAEKLIIGADSSIYFGGPLDNLTISGSQQIYLRKISKTGVTLYEKRFGTQAGLYDDELHALYLDATGKVFIGGFFQKTVDFDTSPTASSIKASNVATSSFVAAYAANGDYRWAAAVEDNRIGYNLKDINSQHTDKNGNTYLGGSFYGAIGFDSYSANNFYKSGPTATNNSFICKYAPNAQVKWAFTYYSVNENRLFDIATDANQNVYVTGYFSGMVDFDPGPGTFSLNSSSSSDIYIAKYDSSGNFLWAKQIGNTDDDEGHKILVRNNKIYVSGIFKGSVDFDPSAGTAVMTSTQTRAFFATYDLNGNYILAKNFFGEYQSINIDANGNVILTGLYSPTSSLIDFDFGSGVAIPISINANSGFIAKYDSLLNYMWAVSIGSPSKCILDSAQNLYVSGSTNANTVRFYSTNNAYTTVSKGNTSNLHQYTLAKYAPNGLLDWVKNTSYTASSATDFGYDFALDKKSNIYVTGQFKDTVDFDFNAGTSILLPFSVTNPDAFIASYSSNGDFIWVKTKQEFASQRFNSISIYDDKLYSIIITGEGYNLDFNPGGSFLIGESTYLTKYTLSCLNSAQITSVTPAARCGSGAVTLSANSNSGIPNWYSTATSSSVLFSGYSFTTPNLTASKTYYVVVPSGVCTPARVPVTATINAIPTITSSTTTVRCDPGTGTINAQASAGIINWYDAPIGGNLLATGTSYSVPFTSVTDTFYVDATANGCTSLTRTPRIFRIIPTPTLLSYAGDSGCANAQISLTAAVNFGNIEWQTATGTYLWGSPTYNVFIATSTTYYVIGTNSGCNTAPVAVTATVVPTPSIASTSPASKCDSGIVTLTVIPSPSNAVVKWYDQSVFGTVLSTGNSFTTPFLSTSATYYAEVSKDGCTNSSRSTVVATINPLPYVGVTNSASTVTALLPGASYQWLNCSNYSPISGANSQSYTATVNGSYAVSITQNGCTDTSACTTIINAATPDANSFETTLKISPNPFMDWIEIKASQFNSNTSLNILDALGRIIYNEENFMLTNSARIATSDWPTGIYFLRIKSASETKVFKLKKGE